MGSPPGLKMVIERGEKQQEEPVSALAKRENFEYAFFPTITDE